MKISEVATHGRRAVIELREKIINGELPGGMRLFEVSLAEALQISRTPVREALSRLAAERGVEAEALARIQDIVTRLDACFGPNEEDVDFDAYSDLNAAFHVELAALSGSQIVRREVERATALPFASPSAFLPNKMEIAAFRRSLRTAQEQHHAMLNAIVSREGARAEFIAREHARIARQNLEYIFSQDPELLQKIPGLALIRH